MTKRSQTSAAVLGRDASPIRYVWHASFETHNAIRDLVDGDAPLDEREFAASFMPDDVTRATAKKMHYAAYRADTSRKAAERRRWRERYFRLRDRIILGNRKLIFGAVRKKIHESQCSDDWIGECYIVMIRAVAAYNPWLGIRFSTYAVTCLLRALGRLSQRRMADRFARHLSLDQVSEAEPARFDDVSMPAPRLGDFLRQDHPLLSDREKMVLRRRFRFPEAAATAADATLENVGRDLGISKERVRQVQASALDKLRAALGDRVLAF